MQKKEKKNEKMYMKDVKNKSAKESGKKRQNNISMKRRRRKKRKLDSYFTPGNYSHVQERRKRKGNEKVILAFLLDSC